jgi:DNA-binding NarL/FixJ family response regulator
VIRRHQILIVDDDAALCQLVHDGLGHEGFDITSAGSAEQALTTLAEAEFDAALVDINMPQMNGIETLIAMRKRCMETPVLMLTISQHEEDLIGAIRSGASGYLLKNAEPEMLRQTIKQVVDGKSVLAPEITEQVFRLVRSGQLGSGNLLTDREVEVLHFLARGLTTAQTGTEMFISENTVKTHVRHILEKLDVSNRAEAVAKATQLGLI